MRRRRRVSGDGAERSSLICARLVDLPEVAAAGTVMAYHSVPGEPDLTEVALWCRAHGSTVVAPIAHPTAPWPVDPASVDVVFVPGLAFTLDGRRLGQGGGWYDRFLSAMRDDAIVIGVSFDDHVVAELPVEDHDVTVDLLVTESGITGRRRRP